jgi:hypothetical protein
MKTTLTLLAFFLAVATAADAQVAPEATSGTASLDYSLNYAQTTTLYGGGLGNQQRSTASGILDYADGSVRLPFHVTVAGGVGWTEAGTSYGNGFYEDLALSQGIIWRKTTIVIGDSLSCLPLSPVTGFSGVPGTGEPIGGSGQAPTTNQSILTLNTRSIANGVNGSVSKILNSDWSLSGGGGMFKLIYPDGNGLDTNSESANATISRRLSKLTSLDGVYSFSKFSYPGYDFSLRSNSLLFGGKRQWNRSLTTNANVGAGWTSSSGSVGSLGSSGSSGNSGSSGSSGSSPVPSSTRLSVTASISYQLRHGTASVNYLRSTSGGGGYTLGAYVDAVNANYSWDAGKSLTIGFEGDYTRTATLQGTGVTNGKIVGTQAGWRMGRYLSVFANYTVLDQSSSAALQGSVLGSLYQTISFGVGFSPRKLRPFSQ